MLLSWFLVGLVTGLIIWFTQRRTVIKLPQKSGAAKRLVIGGALLRWILSALLLANALIEGIVPGLVAFVGLMLSRWFGVLSLQVIPIRSERKSQRS